MRGKLFSAVLLTSGIATAAVPIDGWYASLFGGYSYLPNNLNIYHDGYKFSHDAYDGGYNFGGRFGYKNNPLRFEGEFTYINASLEKFNINSIARQNVSGYASVPVIMANIYYDFPEIIQSIEPFLGIGIGYSWVNSKLASTLPLPIVNYKSSNTIFSYQGTAGLSFNYSERFSLDAAYRYLATDKVGHLGRLFQASLVTIGATYRFDESRYK